MKWFVFTAALLHGLIHILGFLKGSGFKEVRELTLPVSKPEGIIWLSATSLFVLFAILFITGNKYAWLAGIAAVIVSQVLIILFWKDAAFGTLPNVLILAVSVFSFGTFSFNKLIEHETNLILSQNNPKNEKIITESDIESLPGPVKKWLSHSGAVGRPYVNVGKVLQKAEMKLKPEQESWMDATAVQYTTIGNPAFIWSVDVKINRVLSFKGRDRFENGKGRMLIKMNSLINIVNDHGEKLDEGTLQRYLGEMVWFPSLALSRHITWEALNDSTARATMNYNGTTGSGTFYFNAAGDVTRFSALRYKGNEPDARRHEWVMEIEGYNIFEGIKVPAEMSASWILEDGAWTWLKMEVTEIKYNDNIDN